MARYYFHMIGDGIEFLDGEGEILIDLKAAHSHAVSLIRGVQSLCHQRQFNRWRISVVTSTGSIRLVVLFSATLKRSQFSVSDRSRSAGCRANYASQRVAHFPSVSAERFPLCDTSHSPRREPICGQARTHPAVVQTKHPSIYPSPCAVWMIFD